MQAALQGGLHGAADVASGASVMGVGVALVPG
jgi:hypothetical protein